MKKKLPDKIKHVSLKEECNGMSCEYAIINLRDTHLVDILIVSFNGKYRDGSSGKAELGYLVGMVNLGIEVWKPFKVLIDIRNVTYSWGNDMEKLFAQNEHLNVVLVLSEKNIDAICTLINGLENEKKIIDQKFFFDDFHKALEMLKKMKMKNWDNALKRWY